MIEFIMEEEVKIKKLNASNSKSKDSASNICNSLNEFSLMFNKYKIE